MAVSVDNSEPVLVDQYSVQDGRVENARLTALSTVRESSVAKAMTESDAPAYVSN